MSFNTLADGNPMLLDVIGEYMRSDFNWFLIQEVLVCICSVKEFWSIVGQYMAAPYVSVVGTCL